MFLTGDTSWYFINVSLENLNAVNPPCACHNTQVYFSHWSHKLIETLTWQFWWTAGSWGHKINVKKKFTTFLCTQWNFKQWNKKKKQFFWNCNKKNKVPRNELNKICEGPIHWKLQSVIKRDWKRQWNEKVFGIHGLEESTQLKCTYYSKQYRDIRQTPLKSQSHFKK